MFNKIHLLSSCGLICTFPGAEAPLPPSILSLDGTLGRGPSSHKHSRILSGFSLPFFPSASSWRMCSKATFGVRSGAHQLLNLDPAPSHLPWEAQQEQHPGSLSNCPLGSLAHTAMGWNFSFQQGNAVPALQGKALKGPRPKQSKILQ